MDLKEYFEAWPEVGPDSEPGGWVARVHRGLGMRDSETWDEGTTWAVKKLQKDAGLPETGVVAGTTWALLMPEVRPGQLNSELAGVRAFLEVPGRSNYLDGGLVEALSLDEDAPLDRVTWAKLVGLSWAPKDDEVEPEAEKSVAVEKEKGVSGDTPAAAPVSKSKSQPAPVGQVPVEKPTENLDN